MHLSQVLNLYNYMIGLTHGSMCELMTFLTITFIVTLGTPDRSSIIYIIRHAPVEACVK